MDLFMEFEYDFLETNGIPTAHCAGRARSGIPVILLHGFPEHWYGWIQHTKRIGINETIYYLPAEKCPKWLI
jgi:hypothetical protein